MPLSVLLTFGSTTEIHLILLPKPRSGGARTGAYRLAGGSKIICQGYSGSLFSITRRLERVLLQNRRIGWTLRAGNPGIYGSRGGTTIALAPEQGIHRRLWGARNRVGGLQDSEGAFEERLQEYGGAV